MQVYIQSKKLLQEVLLDFIDNRNNKRTEESYQNLVSIIDSQKIKKDKHEFQMFVYLIMAIVNNHHRFPNMLSKIEKIIIFLKDELMTFFTQDEIFNTFKDNKRVLMFLFKIEILHLNDSILNIMKNLDDYNKDYSIYFSPEIKKYNADLKVENNLGKIQNDFENKRLIGENDNDICQIIRQDQIDNFIAYVKQKNIPLSSKVGYDISLNI